VLTLLLLPPFAGLVSLAEPSLFTPEHVAYITSLARSQACAKSIFASILTFGRHFASSWVTCTELNHFAPDLNDLPFAAESEWEHREGILSWTSIVNHLTSSSSTSTSSSRSLSLRAPATAAAAADRLSPQQAGETYVTLLHLVTGGWRLSTDHTEDDTWKRVEADDEVMDAVGQALRDLVGECDDMWEQVDMFYTLRGVSCSSQQCERMRAVVERSLPAQQDDPLLGFFRSLSQR
jgi:hypothetical protein